MKALPLLASLNILLTSLSVSYAAPILQYEFNQSGSTQTSTGSSALALSVVNYSNVATNYVGNAPVGRGGAVTTAALNFTESNVDTGLAAGDFAKGVAQVGINSTNAAYLREGLGSFTISAWVLNSYAHGNISADRRVFSLRNAAGQAIIDLRLVNPVGAATNAMALSLFGTEGSVALTSATNAIPTNNNEWYFLAVSYDASTGAVSFYSGVEGGALVSVTLSNTVGGEINNLLQNANILNIGNFGYNHQRRFDGYLSDLQFHGTALSAQEIGELHAIPEPGSVALLGVSLIALAARPWKMIQR